MDITAVLVYTATGGIVGLLAGLFGVGGGIVTVPVLFFYLRFKGLEEAVAMPVAVATSLAAMWFSSPVSAFHHHRHHSVHWDLVKRWTPYVIIGAVTGVLTAHWMTGSILKPAFGVFLLLAALNMLLSPLHWISPRPLAGRGIQSVAACLIGLLSAMLGIGGGTMVVPLLHYWSFAATHAVATASVFGIVISFPAAIAYMVAGWDVLQFDFPHAGYIHLQALLFIGIATVVLTPLGVRLAYRLPVETLRRLFALVMMVTAVRMMVS